MRRTERSLPYWSLGKPVPAAPAKLHREDVLLPISPQPTHNNTEKNLYTTETKHRDIELYIDLRALVPVERLSDTIVLGYNNTYTHTKLKL